MFSVIFDSFREVVESAVGTLFFVFCVYLGIPFLYGGISISPDTTIASIFIDQPIGWWWTTVSGHIISFFEWVFSQINPLWIQLDPIELTLDVLHLGGV